MSATVNEHIIRLDPAEIASYIERQKRAALWAKIARPEQLPPEGDWRVWYLRGGRGSGKTRTGAETMATWLRTYQAPPDEPPLEWGIVAPTFGDARAVCVEGPAGLLQALGKQEVVSWNRSEGVLTTRSGSKVYTDGGDDGALRVQGHNLSGCWADEVGLWRDWDRAWNESIAFAVRAEIGPAKIVATGTPKMAHPLIAYLLRAPGVVRSHMRTIDNAENLDPSALKDLLERYEGSTLGRQELEGEFIEALEGSILPRRAWKFSDVRASMWAGGKFDATYLPHFDQIVHSWDTALKAKTTNDHVAGQAWGCAGPDRYLLGLWCGHAGLEATVKEMKGLLAWTREHWPRTPHRVLIENTSNGPDAIAEMSKHVDGIYPVRLRQGDDKVRRALTAAPALETGHCYLPGEATKDGKGRGYETNGTPIPVQMFVEECSIFPIDDQPRTRSLRGREEQERLFDDQVDAWSQMVNWTRSQSHGKSGITRARGRLPRVGQLTG